MNRSIYWDGLSTTNLFAEERCDPVNITAHATPDTTNTSWGSVVTYRCNVGHEWPNNVTTYSITCNPGGDWTPTFTDKNDCQRIFHNLVVFFVISFCIFYIYLIYFISVYLIYVLLFHFVILIPFLSNINKLHSDLHSLFLFRRRLKATLFHPRLVLWGRTHLGWVSLKRRYKNL